MKKSSQKPTLGEHESEAAALFSAKEGTERLHKNAIRCLVAVALAWSCFQLWFNSPLPFWLGVGVFNDTQARSVHLAFALLLAFLIYPFDKHGSQGRLPILDMFLALAAAFCGGYLFLFYEQLALRLGDPSPLDITAGLVGLGVLLEAARRTVGWPLPIIAVVTLLYALSGPYLPDVIAHKGASLDRLVTHQWLTTEGVFGVPLGVSTTFIFMFVLLGAMLQQAGAGRYFILLAFSLLGHLRGGPAKAAVVASGLTGLVSGSSIANVVTTGTFTIPLMRQAGYTRAQAAAVEVASSTNGQLMPPIMGAAAFLMVEYLGIPYVEVIRHAFLPALISYIALIYLVHLEALKADLPIFREGPQHTWKWRLLRFGLTFSGSIAAIGLIYGVLTMLPRLFGAWADAALFVILLGLYIYLVYYSTKAPILRRLKVDSLAELPPLNQTAKTGLYYLLPILVLIWCLAIKKFSPGLSAFYSVVSLSVILLTQHFIFFAFRHELEWRVALKKGFLEFKDSLIGGAYNMVPIALATATAGIIVGVVSLTGIGFALTDVVEMLSMGSLALVLILTAIFCMILGMGLPTTANYIVVATLMAPVIATLAATHGLVVPLIAIHLFVFYFGVMADVTPPVGLGAFAAAAIAGENPIKTGLQAFAYSARILLLPFIFIFNTELLLIGIDSFWGFLKIFIVAVVAILIFVAGTQGYFLVRSRRWESAILILVALTLFRPDFWVDRIFPPFVEVPVKEFSQALSKLKVDDPMRLNMTIHERDKVKQRTFVFRVPEGPVDDRLENIGLEVEREGDTYAVKDVVFFSPAENMGLNVLNRNVITGLAKPAPQPRPEWFFIPAFALFAFVIFRQRRRRQV